MKYIKEHLMFILPMMAILLGIDFYLVFDRMTSNYEAALRDGYSMLAITKKEMNTQEFKKLNAEISESSRIDKSEIIKQISSNQSKADVEDILKALPYFYTLKLEKYVDMDSIEQIKKSLLKSTDIKRVETFGDSYYSKYRLFSFIKFTLKVFIFFMVLVSLFLVIKQMEIWGYKHRQRIRVMEIFGAPLMLRSGVLFRVALSDAFIATFLIVLFFSYLRFLWAGSSGVNIMIEQKEMLFQLKDIAILLTSSVFIVIISVFSVVLGIKENEE